jgi:branched-subunit amino acid aminotransferase/4-amino-4-deoxychorismate lyase
MLSHCKLLNSVSAEPELIGRFEGMKAYRQEDDTVRLFRPDKNMARMNKSAARLALPVS